MLSQAFSSVEYIENLGFSALHNILFGFWQGHIEEQLSKTPEMVNATDSLGISALSWAAQRGDIQAVHILLEHGADPNLCDCNDVSPLSWSVQSPTPECTKLLLAAGGKSTQAQNGWTPVLNACYGHDEPDLIESLIKAGESALHLITQEKETPLMISVINDHFNSAEYLLSRREVDLEARNIDGRTALLLALKNNSSSSIQVLLQHGACCSVTDNEGQTVLHHAAAFTKIGALDILAQYHLQEVLPEAINSQGLTAWDLLISLKPAPERTAAFLRLIESINAVPPDDNLDDVEFVDALEHQS